MHGKLQFFPCVVKKYLRKFDGCTLSLFTGMLKCAHNTWSMSFQVIFSQFVVFNDALRMIFNCDTRMSTKSLHKRSFLLLVAVFCSNKAWQCFWVCTVSFKQELGSRLLEPQEIKFIYLSDNITISFSVLKARNIFLSVSHKLHKDKNFLMGRK